MQIVTNSRGQVVGSFSWVNGFKRLQQPRKDLREEARRNPEAVINRLFLEERYEEAEEIFDEFV